MNRVQVTPIVLIVLVMGCGGGGGASSAPTPCPLPPPSGDEELLLEDLALTDYGILTMTKEERGFAQARIVSETAIVELYPPIARSMLDNGYTILSGDNEGFEAEIFFKRGGDLNGTLYMREGPCRDQVTLTLTYGSARTGGQG